MSQSLPHVQKSSNHKFEGFVNLLGSEVKLLACACLWVATWAPAISYQPLQEGTGWGWKLLSISEKESRTKGRSWKQNWFRIQSGMECQGVELEMESVKWTPKKKTKGSNVDECLGKKAGIKTSWEDAGCRGVEAAEQRDGLTPRSFQGTCSLTLPKDRHSSVKIWTNHRNLILDTQGEWGKSLYMFVCLSSPASSCLCKSAGGHGVLAVLPRLKIIKTRRQMRTWSQYQENQLPCISQLKHLGQKLTQIHLMFWQFCIAKTFQKTASQGDEMQKCFPSFITEKETGCLPSVFNTKLYPHSPADIL